MLPWNSNIGDNIAMPAAKKVFLVSVRVEMRPVLLVSHSPSSLSFATLLNPSLPLTHHCSFFCTPLSSLLLCFFLLLHFSCHPYPLFLLPSLLYNPYLTFPSPSFHLPSPFALTHDYQRPTAVIKK